MKYRGWLIISITLTITVQNFYILLNIKQTEMKLSNDKMEVVFFQFAYLLVPTTYHLLPLVCFSAFYLKLQTSVTNNETF